MAQSFVPKCGWQSSSCHQNQARSCQKLEKSIFKYFLNESCHQNQDRAKSWKNQFFNIFLVVPPFHILRCLCHLSTRHGNKSWRNQFGIFFLIQCCIEKSCRQNQDRTGNQFLNTFLNYNLNRNKLPPKPRPCQKLEKSIFEYFFKLNSD